MRFPESVSKLPRPTLYEQLCTVACKPRRVCQCDDPDAASPFVLALLEENPDAMLLVDGDYVRMVPY